MDKNKENERGGGLAPRNRLIIGPDRRAQAVLRAAERPKDKKVLEGQLGVTTTTIKNPGVGIKAKDTESYKAYRGTESSLEFSRYKPGQDKASHQTKADMRHAGKPALKTAHSLHKDRLRSAAVKHAMGRQLTDVRPGNTVSASTVRARSGLNPRGRAYEQQTNGALNYERGKKSYAQSTKLTEDTWQPNNTNSPVKFNPNNLKNSLKAMAQGTIVRQTTKLIGGPVAQAAVTTDDAVAAATGKRPSKEIAKGHVNQQSLLIKAMQEKKKKQAPWVGSGPF